MQMSTNTAAYDDGEIRCDHQGLTIRRYYPWGAKRIATPRSGALKRSP
jgi:hypothetical protein